MTADAQASFALNLEDGTSGAAASAANALSSLRNKLDGDTKALRAMQSAMKNLQGGTVVNIKQFQELRDKIAAKKTAIAESQSAFISLGGTFDKVKPPTGRFAQFALAAKSMPGPLGGLISQFGSLNQLLAKGVMVVGIVALVAGLALLVVAAVSATAALLQYGIAQADARRSELLHLEGLTKLRSYYGLAAGNASQMQEQIDRVSASVALGRDKVAQYSDKLYRMGLRGDNLAAALEGTAIKATVLGDAQASMFAGWAAGAARTGHSVRALADDVKARLGGVAQKQMLSLTVQSEKQRESFAALFSGLKIDGFLKGMASVRALFSQNTQSGQALKAMLTTALQPLINAAESGAPIVKRFFQGIIIGALRIGIVLLQVRNWFKRTFGGSDVLKGFDLTNAALHAGEVFVGLLATGLVIAGLAVVALATKMATFLLPMLWSLIARVGALAIEGLLIAAPFLLAAIAIGAVIAAGYQLYKLWQEIDWKDLGRSIVSGIVKGLTAGKKWVVDTVSGLGKTAFKTFKQVLGIASPSKEFAKLGVAMPQGVAQGVQKGSPAVNQAVSRMVDVPTEPIGVGDVSAFAPRIPASAAGSGSSGAAGAAAGANVSVSIGDVHVHTTSDKPKDMAIDFKRELERLLEGVAIQLGAPTPEGV